MKPAQARIAKLWCRLMHTAHMWPSHGQKVQLARPWNEMTAAFFAQ